MFEFVKRWFRKDNKRVMAAGSTAREEERDFEAPANELLIYTQSGARRKGKYHKCRHCGKKSFGYTSAPRCCGYMMDDEWDFFDVYLAMMFVDLMIGDPGYDTNAYEAQASADVTDAIIADAPEGEIYPAPEDTIDLNTIEEGVQSSHHGGSHETTFERHIDPEPVHERTFERSPDPEPVYETTRETHGSYSAPSGGGGSYESSSYESGGGDCGGGDCGGDGGGD